MIGNIEVFSEDLDGKSNTDFIIGKDIRNMGRFDCHKDGTYIFDFTPEKTK